MVVNWGQATLFGLLSVFASSLLWLWLVCESERSGTLMFVPQFRQRTTRPRALSGTLSMRLQVSFGHMMRSVSSLIS